MTTASYDRGEQVIARCRLLAEMTEIPGETTRLFLSPPMHDVHARIRVWMEAAGMSVRVDAAGNLRGLYPAAGAAPSRLIIASHLDTVPNAGAFDGVLGVMLGVAAVEELHGQHLPFSIEVIGFSEEEGVRFGKPFLGSLALIGKLDAATLDRADQHGITVAEAIRNFGLDPSQLQNASIDEGAFAYLEVHIEQGPILESDHRSLGVVDAIAGQTRLQLTFTGQANHAGTTPMRLRHDALAAAAHWIVEVERHALSREGLVATVGRIDARPGATNVIAGEVNVSLDVRHAEDSVRHIAVAELLARAKFAASTRGVTVAATKILDQAAVPMDGQLVETLQLAAEQAGFSTNRMTSGAGHDAMILAGKIPSVMLFLRSPGGLSHHPDESVAAHDVEAALTTAMRLLSLLQERKQAAVG